MFNLGCNCLKKERTILFYTKKKPILVFFLPFGEMWETQGSSSGYCFSFSKEVFEGKQLDAGTPTIQDHGNIHLLKIPFQKVIQCVQLSKSFLVNTCTNVFAKSSFIRMLTISTSVLEKRENFSLGTKKLLM